MPSRDHMFHFHFGMTLCSLTNFGPAMAGMIQFAFARAATGIGRAASVTPLLVVT
jgi:hypothetical protein